jgi:hypothetical protein
MTTQELTVLWSRHFDSDLPTASVWFWKNYDPAIADEAFSITAKRATKRQFDNMADAARFATGAMRTLKTSRDLQNTPAPSPKVATHA